VHLCNAYTLSLVDRDAALRQALTCSDLNLADGTPVAWFGRRHGMRSPVRGPGLVGDVAQLGTEFGIRHYFYGAGPGVAAQMAERLSNYAPGLDVAGTESPPMRVPDDYELDALAGRLHETQAHLVWIGLGTPKQDYLVPRIAARVPIVAIPVGAAFDFWAGRVYEAPAWLHGTGLEWMHRLASEPRRLWKRYLVGNPRFLISAIRHMAT
jgi:N-acetylglucosaminyldiphosphoundecaprenol N-acetyl-beta-D-mannosaminyltransferase